MPVIAGSGPPVQSASRPITPAPIGRGRPARQNYHSGAGTGGSAIVGLDWTCSVREALRPKSDFAVSLPHRAAGQVKGVSLKAESFPANAPHHYILGGVTQKI